MTTKVSKRFLSLVVALIMAIGMIPATTAYAAVGENFPLGCWAYAYTTTPVYQNLSMSSILCRYSKYLHFLYSLQLILQN